MHFWTCGLQKSWLGEYRKSSISEHPSTVKMLKSAKHWWNLYLSISIISFHHSEGNWVRKCLSSWQLKSQDCLLTHRLLMKFVLFLMVRIYRNKFKCSYPKNKKTSKFFLLHFWNIYQISNILKMSLLVISKIFGLFVDTLAADGKCSLANSENLRQPIQMQLSKKQNIFSKILPLFWILHQILNCLKKADPHSFCIFQIRDWERH